MQSYKIPSKNPSGVGELSAYTLMKLNLNQLEIMSKYDLSVDDARHIPMYEEYLSLRRSGVPKERIYQHFNSSYHVSESTVKRDIKRFSRRVTT